MGNKSTKYKEKPRGNGEKPEAQKQQERAFSTNDRPKDTPTNTMETKKRVPCSGKVAVVIGAAQGIGRACVEALLERNAKVCFGDVDEPRGKETLAELKQKHGPDNVIFVKSDICKPADIKAVFSAAVARWGKVDIFSPMAGIMNEKAWRKSIEINLIGTVESTYVAMDYMAKDKGGSGGAIVFMSSFAGHEPFFTSPVYSSTKHAVLGFLKSFADTPQFESHGINLYALCPGPTATNFVLDERVRFKVLLPLVMKEHIGKHELLQPTAVAGAFLRCIEDPTLRGSALTIFCKDGETSVQKLDMTSRTLILPTLVD